MLKSATKHNKKTLRSPSVFEADRTPESMLKAPEARPEGSPRRQPWVRCAIWCRAPEGRHIVTLHTRSLSRSAVSVWVKILCRASGALVSFHLTHGDAVGYPLVAPPALGAWHEYQHNRQPRGR